MLIKDRVYGDEEVNESVLMELIESPTVQRLKGISQHGMPEDYFYRAVFSRFEHSLGVLILLRRLNANLNEQIAGLLHDISHTAFSHVVDWVIGDPSKQDHQDNIFKEFLKNSEIPSILEKHNIDVEKVSDIDSFPLLEKEAPNLCADRVDYTLRDLSLLGFKDSVKFILDNISSLNGQIAFKTKEAAEKFGRSYTFMSREHWGGHAPTARYHILANILKKAIDLGEISLEDFHRTDSEILEKLHNLKDGKIQKGLKRLNGKFGINYVDSGENTIAVRTKFRYVDPEVLIGDSLKNLSSISPDYLNLIEREKNNYQSAVNVEIID